MKIILEKEIPKSWNLMYAGVHWVTRKKEAQRVHTLVKYMTLKTKRFDRPVAITITVYFKQKPLMDADNICAKLYIDGLKDYVIINDSPDYVTSVTTCSKLDKENPRVEILIKETRVIVNPYE